MIGLLAAIALARSGPGKLPEEVGGLKGYISMNVSRPPAAFGYGVSFYSSVWPLISETIDSFQIGLPATWIVPDNLDFTQPLCPPGTIARDNWPERGPTYRDVFQTIEGGLGYWANTQFGSTTPKYRINGTPNGYNDEISTPGWGFGNVKPFPGDKMGIAQLSNRLLLPPDGLTFAKASDGEIVGNAWMALPFTPASKSPHDGHETPTGDQSWTLFLNTANFKGAVAYWIPETWSKLSRGYPTIDGRGLDARPGLMDGGAMEVNTVPYFESRDAKGVLYSRLPKLRFPVDASGRTVLMQNVQMYSKQALFDEVAKWMTGGRAASGAFQTAGVFQATCTANPISFRQGPKDTPMTGFDPILQTKIFGGPGSFAFGLQWGAGARGDFPEYYREENGHMIAIPASEVPADTHLADQTFAPKHPGGPYASPAPGDRSWQEPGPVKGPFRVKLADGSVVTYAWYRFIDQPALQQLHLASPARKRLQAIVEMIHRAWTPDKTFMPPPSSGRLAKLDPALIVTPPKGLEVGYVPVVIRQATDRD